MSVTPIVAMKYDVLMNIVATGKIQTLSIEIISMIWTLDLPSLVYKIQIRTFIIGIKIANSNV